MLTGCPRNVFDKKRLFHLVNNTTDWVRVISAFPKQWDIIYLKKMCFIDNSLVIHNNNTNFKDRIETSNMISFYNLNSLLTSKR